MSQSPVARRTLLKTLAATAVAWPLLRPTLNAERSAQSETANSGHPLKLGLASISLHALSLESVIAALQRFELHYVSLYKTHAPWGGDPAACALAAEKVRAAGLHLMSTGVVNLPNDEAVVDRAFACAVAAKLPVMTCRPEVAAFPLVERYVKKYSIKLAIHNHGPEDKLYASPDDAWTLIQKYDERIGLCIDAGHTIRSGIDPIVAIKQCAKRLYDFHLKDTVSPVGTEDVPVEIGRGRIDIPGVLKALQDVSYDYQVGIEYEVEGKGKADPLPGVAESLGYVRGVLAVLRREGAPI